jgi:hypothetical protein
MRITRKAKSTLTALEIVHGDVVEFGLEDGTVTEIELIDTGAAIMETTLEQVGVGAPGGFTTYRFWGDVLVNGTPVRLEREVGTQKSFYEPWVIGEVRIWLDAVDAIFEFMRETHGACRLQENYSNSLPARRQAW